MRVLLLSRLSFERVAIGVIAVAIALLYAVVLSDSGRQPPGAGGHATGAQTFAALPGAGPATGLAQVPTVKVDGVESLKGLFTRLDYRLDAVRGEGAVPRIFVASLPGDITRIDRPTQRKAVFIRTALPLVLRVNERVMGERRSLMALHDRHLAGAKMTAAERRWLDGLAARYGLAQPDFAELLRRVDVVPPSLALAQAAEESGWGTSRFAREGNALFGQRVFDRSAGLVPAQRAAGEIYKVRAFDRLLDGVAAYVHNLNSHSAYAEFRAERAALRAGARALDGYALAAALHRYSERGVQYVQSIRRIIRTSGLRTFDRARLKPEVSAALRRFISG